MNRSVFVFVLFALVASAIAKPHHEEFEAAKQKCIAETGVDPELVKRPPPPEGTIDDKVKCFGACLMKDHGVLKDDGSIDAEKAISYLPEDIPEREKIVEAIKTCSEKKGTDDCDTAHEVFQCLRENKVPHLHHHHHKH